MRLMNAPDPTALTALARSIQNARWLGAVADAHWKGASIDSRSPQQGNIFFALKGEHVNGHDFVQQALTAGASCAVVERTPDPSISALGPVLLVPDVVTAMAQAATAYRRTSLAQTLVLAVN